MQIDKSSMHLLAQRLLKWTAAALSVKGNIYLELEYLESPCQGENVAIRPWEIADCKRVRVLPGVGSAEGKMIESSKNLSCCPELEGISCHPAWHMGPPTLQHSFFNDSRESLISVNLLELSLLHHTSKPTYPAPPSFSNPLAVWLMAPILDPV